jgi:hypothetical protein
MNGDLKEASSMNLRSRQCDENEAKRFEVELRTQGMRLVEKQTDKDLLPGEYVKRSHTGTEHVIGGKRIYTFTWVPLK